MYHLLHCAWEILLGGFAFTVFVLLLLVVSFLVSGCATNGHPMRFKPALDAQGAVTNQPLSWYIEGKTTNGRPISCSFVEFDERGDFIDFRQHLACEDCISNLVKTSDHVLVVMYCHGWKNNSQSGDVIRFNSFLAKIAESPDVIQHGYRVHGVYLSWRGNVVHPYVERSGSDDDYNFYCQCTTNYGGEIVDKKYNRFSYWLGWIPENFDFFTRQRAAEHLVSGLPLARAIFTYASAAKDYGHKPGNQVVVMGHSMGALMLERSLGQALTGSLVMEWWNGINGTNAVQNPAVPFDLILFLNSAAPSIYAKEMRDFLEANRNSERYTGNPDAPVIISLTSTADSATGTLYPIAHIFAPLKPSLKRRYKSGIFEDQDKGQPSIRQSVFYTHTPGHQRYLINHWVKQEKSMTNAIPSDVFAANISQENVSNPYVFYTSDPPAAWKITKDTAHPVTYKGQPLAMSDSDYWIMNCGKDLIASHGDIWSTRDMEMYAAFYRLTAYLKKTSPPQP